MAFLDPAVNRFQDFLLDQNNKGQYDDLSAKHPDELEVWACAFEMVNSNGQVEDFFSFPVMPNAISQSRATNVTIKKTLGGVVVNNNPTFVPFDISINGNFGMRFRKVSNTPRNQAAGANDTSVFSTDYKTGYGNTKILENLMLKSQTLDQWGGNYLLLFYNLSFNSKFLVEPMNYTFSASQDRSRIWNYSIQLKAIAPASAVRNADQLKSSLQSLMNYKKQNKMYAKYSADILFLMKTDLDTYRNRLPKVLKMLNSVALSNAIGVVNAISPWHEANKLMKNPKGVQNFIVKMDRKVLKLL